METYDKDAKNNGGQENKTGNDRGMNESPEQRDQDEGSMQNGTVGGEGVADNMDGSTDSSSGAGSAGSTGGDIGGGGGTTKGSGSTGNNS